LWQTAASVKKCRQKPWRVTATSPSGVMKCRTICAPWNRNCKSTRKILLLCDAGASALTHHGISFVGTRSAVSLTVKPGVPELITGPTFEEMLHPQTIAPDIREKALRMRTQDPLDPINLFNITWRDANNQVYHIVLPKQLTGVDANIGVIYGKEFPSGSHKVGAAYSVLLEKELFGEVDPEQHTLAWPSTGNYGIGGAWVGCRMGCKSLVVLPAGMSQERFDRIHSYGAEIIR